MAKTLDAAGVKRLIQEIKGANKNLNAPIPISTENTPESKAQNVKNIAAYVEKAKAAGIASVNGMAVNCLIDGGGYSGVGYLNGDTDTSICAIEIFDDSSNPMYFKVDPDGTYEEVQIITENSVNIVTSDMLVEGARKPIIITGDMTEVDEETYQKLLKGDTDVIANFGEGTFIESQAKFNTGDTLNLIFGYSQFDESDGAISTYTISINTSAPHTLTLAVMGLCEPVSKSILSPVLQEIDLRGTDADRKAKLDQFETDWKALTGADDLTGARFVGKFGITDDVERNVTGIMTYCAGDSANEANDNCFYGICNGYSFSEQKSQIAVKVSCKNGSLTITPLFSHLEAITIKAGNTPEDKAANVAAIKAYVDNLTALGVDTTKGYMIPVKLDNDYHGFIMGTDANGGHTGVIKKNTYNYGGGWIFIDKIGTYQYLEFLTYGNIGGLTTKSQAIVPAINEVNALVEKKADKTLNAKSLEAITIRTGNTPDNKAANVAAIKAYVDNLKLLGVDVTKGYMIPAKLDAGNLDGFVSYHSDTVDYPWSGVFIRPGGSGKFGAINKDGFVVLIDDILVSGNIYKTLTTTSKGIIPAINEINANAVHSDKLVPTLEAITIRTGKTPENKAANLAAINAYVDNLKALGVDVTKGYMIPVKLDNGYHGFIMGTGADGGHTGIIKRNTYNYGGGWIFIDNIGTCQYLECLTLGSYDNLTTTAKTIVPAINEVNALVEEKADKTLNAKSLEAITIYTDNTPEHKQANLDNIAAYEANLQALGVDVTKGWNAPISFSSGDFGIFFHITEGEYYVGIMANKNTITSPYSYGVRKSDGYLYRTNIITQASTISSLTTTSKKIVGAINEVNALAKGYSTIFTPIELTTETAQNKTAIDARVAAFTAQGISLTNGCCIPVTYKGMYAGNISLINGDWYGLLVKNTNNPADNINIKLSADGTITEGNSAQ